MSNAAHCINCERSEDEAPILSVKFKGQDVGICSSCLPILIHKPQQLAGKLEGAGEIQPTPHSH